MNQRISYGKIIGFEEIPGLNPKDGNIASHALVIMFIAINDDLRIPIAYYFISSIEAGTKSVNIRKIIQLVLHCGVLVTSMTFDGHKSNPATCHALGANLDVFSNNFNPSFDIKGSTIQIIYDPSHFIKLLRDSVARNRLYDAENKPIKWTYCERLVRFSERNNLKSMHKLTQALIDFQSNIMNKQFQLHPNPI